MGADTRTRFTFFLSLSSNVRLIVSSASSFRIRFGMEGVYSASMTCFGGRPPRGWSRLKVVAMTLKYRLERSKSFDEGDMLSDQPMVYTTQIWKSRNSK